MESSAPGSRSDRIIEMIYHVRWDDYGLAGRKMDGVGVEAGRMSASDSPPSLVALRLPPSGDTPCPPR